MTATTTVILPKFAGNYPARLTLPIAADTLIIKGTQVAKDAGLSRESLYRALSEDGNPSFATILKVARAVGTRVPCRSSRRAHWARTARCTWCASGIAPS